ncbi:MAG: putative quinol monooxygenase [Deltaproteobacteria bacterium]
MIHVIATIPVQEGKAEEFEAIFKALGEKVRANEEGCQRYEVCKSLDRPDHYVIVELYTDKESLDAHGKTDYFRAAGKEFMPLIAGAPDIQFIPA